MPDDETKQTSASPLLRNVPDGDGQRVEMLCPKCEEWQDILAYKNVDVARKFFTALNPIVKCMRCKHLFSPRVFGS